LCSEKVWATIRSNPPEAPINLQIQIKDPKGERQKANRWSNREKKKAPKMSANPNKLSKVRREFIQNHSNSKLS
jgi:hypothetical protein